MSSIPSNLARVPVSLSSQVLLSNLNRTQTKLLETQVQIATGKRINRPSDDIVSASLVNILENEMGRRQHRFRALDHADAMLGTIDQSLGEVSDLLLQAKSIASEMVNTSVDRDTRKAQATVVDSLIDEMARVANRDLQGIQLFGGERSAVRPVESFLGGFKFSGTKGALKIDVGRATGMPITFSADEAFGSISARVLGNVDLDPTITPEVRISDLNGAQGDGVRLGTVNIDLNGLDMIAVDLTLADSVQDAVDLLQDAITQYETVNSVTLLGSSGVGIDSTAGGIAVDVASGVTLTFSDTLTGRTAADLGLSQSTFTTSDPFGEDLDARVTMLTKVSEMSAITGLGEMMISNAGQNRTIDLSNAQTIEDIKNIIDASEIGVRVEISDDGRSLNVLNDLAGGQMSIYNSLGSDSADQLGIRSFRRDIPLDSMNRGRGVQILSGNVDPVNGNPDPMLDRDFQITLSDGTAFDVDLAGAETIGDVIDIMAAAGPSTFAVGIDPGSGGLVLTDSSGGAGDFAVEPLNGSFAAQDLGIGQSTTSATITGEDGAKVEVDSVFTHLIALRDALLKSDISGITFAGGKFEEDIDRAARARAVVGQRIDRASGMRQREEDEDLLDASLKSQAEDLDFTEASVRFSQLQVFLQATLAAGAQGRNLSLLDFLG